MFRLRLLGGLALVGPDGPVRGRAVQPRRLALLALLGASRNHGWSREKLISLLWPDADPAEARHHLSQSVYLFRKALGEDAISSHGEFIELNTDVVWSDVEAFNSALRAGETAPAIDLYSGPFLDGFYIRGAPEFEEWSETQRRSLADAYAMAVETLARAAGGEGNHIEAADLWRRLVSHDPYNSRAVLGLMESLVEGGDPGNALFVAEEHADRMQQDLGVGVPADVQILVGRIRDNQPAGQAPPSRPKNSAQASRWALDTSVAEGPAPRRSWPLVTGAVFVAVVGVAWGVRVLNRPVVPEVFDAVAVLPFLNLTGDPDSEYLVDGLTDELIATLSRVPGLRVPAQTTSFHFKGTPLDVRLIGDSLSVRKVVEGSVRTVEGGLLITAQLIDAESGFHLWTETFERTQQDWARIPSDIATATVAELGLEEAAGREALRPQTEVLAAWQDYEKGRRFWRLRTREAHDSAIVYFRRTIEADSTFALAWSGLADAYLTSMDVGDIPKTDSVKAEVLAIAARAVELDSALAETRTSYAGALGTVDRDRYGERVEAELRRAIEINPNYPVAHYWYAEFLFSSQRYDEQLQAATRAYEADPLSPVAIHHVGHALWWGQARVADAVQYFEYVLDIEPDHRIAQSNRAVALAHLGRTDEARAAAMKLLEKEGGSPVVAGQVARILLLTRDYEDVLRIIDENQAEAMRYGHFYRSRIHAIQGRYEDALSEYRMGAEKYPDDKEYELLLAYIYALSGDAPRARDIAERVLDSGDSADNPFVLRSASAVYGAMGDNDTAFDLLNRVYERNKGALSTLGANPAFDPLRDDPRFDELLQRLGLPKIEPL